MIAALIMLAFGQVGNQVGSVTVNTPEMTIEQFTTYCNCICHCDPVLCPDLSSQVTQAVRLVRLRQLIYCMEWLPWSLNTPAHLPNPDAVRDLCDPYDLDDDGDVDLRDYARWEVSR